MLVKKLWDYTVKVKKRICAKKGEDIAIVKRGERRRIVQVY